MNATEARAMVAEHEQGVINAIEDSIKEASRYGKWSVQIPWKTIIPPLGNLEQSVVDHFGQLGFKVKFLCDCQIDSIFKKTGFWPWQREWVPVERPIQQSDFLMISWTEEVPKQEE